MAAPTTRELLAFMRTVPFEGSAVDRFKVLLRPATCPLGDLIGLVRPGDVVGDVGCGSGQFALLLHAFARPAAYLGLEISEQLVANARALLAHGQAPNATVEWFDGRTIPARLAGMDIVFLNDVLHHVPPGEQEAFLAAVVDVLRPGARLVLKDIDEASPLVPFNRLHDWLLSGARGHEWSVQRAARFLQRLDLKLEPVRRRRIAVYPHYLIVAVKA